MFDIWIQYEISLLYTTYGSRKNTMLQKGRKLGTSECV
jgi:hypothetical protein